MAEITESDLGQDYWATSDDVQERVRLTIKGNDNPTFTDVIQDATDEVQSWWASETGKTVPDGLPDPIPDLLRSAAAYMAASEAHLRFSRNVRSSDEGGEGRHVFMEKKARQKFEAWENQRDTDPDTGDSSDRTADVQARTGALDPLGDKYD
jgi:hypothetical protein